MTAPQIAMCYSCGTQTEQAFLAGKPMCSFCHAPQCQRVNCTVCDNVMTRPGGEHYFQGASYEKKS